MGGKKIYENGNNLKRMTQGKIKKTQLHCQSLNPNKTGGNAFEVPDKTIFHGMLGWLFELVVWASAAKIWSRRKQSFCHSLGHAPFILSPVAWGLLNNKQSLLIDFWWPSTLENEIYQGLCGKHQVLQCHLKMSSRVTAKYSSSKYREFSSLL